MALVYIPTRAIVALMIFTACFISYMLRVNMSINIIAMVNRVESSSISQTDCILDLHEATNLSAVQTLPDYGERYQWNSEVQGLILGSFFWGYILTSIPGGFLAERYGPTKLVAITTSLSAALTAITPLVAPLHYGIIISLRVVIGLLSGMLFPCLHCLISRWAPPEEKGKFAGALLGGALGTVLTWPLLGIVIENLGWIWAFYLPAALAFTWSALWYIFVADSPEMHSRISLQEKNFIAESLKGKVTYIKVIPPYKHMLLSPPFWGLVILHFGNLWGLYLLMTIGPKYMAEALGFKLGHTGILASLPYLARLIAGFIFGFIGDLFRKRGVMSVNAIRHVFVIFSHLIPGLFLLAQTAVGCNATLAVAFMTLALGFNGASTLTNLQNSQDLAPNFAGTIYGIVNCMGGTTGFITPMLAGYITSEQNGLDGWHLVFWIGSGIYLGCGVMFWFIGSGECQDWNDLPEHRRTSGCYARNSEVIDQPEFLGTRALRRYSDLGINIKKA